MICLSDKLIYEVSSSCRGVKGFPYPIHPYVWVEGTLGKSAAVPVEAVRAVGFENSKCRDNQKLSEPPAASHQELGTEQALPDAKSLLGLQAREK